MFAYINMTNPDVSGMLRFLTDELQAAEDAHESGEVSSLAPGGDRFCRAVILTRVVQCGLSAMC